MIRAMWISLIGFHGAGKQTLARLLARVSARRTVALAALEAGEPPPAGELVIVADAEAVVRPAGREVLASAGLVVWLDAPWPELRRRLSGAASGPPAEIWSGFSEPALRRRHAELRPRYAALARLRLDSGRHGPSALARRLLARTLQLTESSP